MKNKKEDQHGRCLRRSHRFLWLCIGMLVVMESWCITHRWCRDAGFGANVNNDSKYGGGEYFFLQAAKGRRVDIRKRSCWDCSPIVLEAQRLIFFTTPKVGCTEFKKLFRRMMDLPGWNTTSNDKSVHNPDMNGLLYLYDYPQTRAHEMLTSPNWTRAIFVRDPKERLVSAYLDKVGKYKGHYMRRIYCPQPCANHTLLQCDSKHVVIPEGQEFLMTFPQFLHYHVLGRGSSSSSGAATTTTTTPNNPCQMDSHWEPQKYQMEDVYWEHIDFVGHFERLAQDTQVLLQTKLLSDPLAWQKYGAQGWTTTKNAPSHIFAPTTYTQHANNAVDKVAKYINTDELERQIEDYYKLDYNHEPFNFTRRLNWNASS